MAKIRETIGIGNKIARFDVREIYSVESAIKWLGTKCNLNAELYSFRVPGSFDDGGYEYSVDTFDELKVKTKMYESDGISGISCKFKYNKESVWLLIAINRSEVALMIHLDSEIDIDEIAKELGLI